MHGVLIVRDGFKRGTTFRLGSRTLTMGRDPMNGVQLIDDAVSRRHAMVCWEGHAYRIADLHSQNGIFVNGTRVRDVLLHFGDTVRMGGTTLELIADDGMIHDAVLGRKVVDESIVGGSTSMLDIASMDLPPEDDDAKDEGDGSAADAAQMQLVHDLNMGAAQGLAPKLQCEKAAEGVMRIAQPHRFCIYKIGADRVAHRVVWKVALGAPEADRRSNPHGKAINLAVKRRRPVLLRDLPDAGVKSVMVAPVIEGEKRLTGLLYVDNLGAKAENLTEDLHDLIVMIAFTLRAAIS